MKKFLSLLIFGVFLILFIPIVKADTDCSNPGNLSEQEVNKCLSDISKDLDLSIKATKPSEIQLNSIKTRVTFIEADLVKKKQEINNGYKNLEDKKIIFDKTVTRNYIESYNNNWLSYLVGTQATGIIQNLAYQKAKADQDKVIITNIALSITDLEAKRKNLENEEIKLAAIKISLDKVVTEAKTYQATLTNKIAALSKRQQEILNQRLTNLHIPRSAGSGGSCSSDLTNGKSAGFSGGFGLFTYGVPNRVGLSQYGAFGRAKDGKLVEDILSAYYTNYELKKDYSQDATINVEGGPSLKIEDYLKHLGEMPESWGNEGGFEALKAQAIAARSYALAYTNNGQNSICGTDSCQVFLAGEKGGKWNEAVEATKGWVMVQGGQPIKSWFSSAHGGYIHSSGDIGWNSTSWTKNAQDTLGDISSFADLTSRAYDSPSHTDTTTQSFYCDWGARSAYGGTAWLQSNELADIVNVIKLASIDSSVGCFVFQTDKAPPAPNPAEGCAATDNWSADTVKQKLRDKGVAPFDSVSNISVDVDWGSGKVSNVHVNGNVSDSFSGSFFKDYFNLRAPANIQIVGPLYNIERN